jgi:hypothetical protein
MKKLIFSLIVFCGLSMLYVSCSNKKGMQNIRGKVVSLDIKNDSVNGDQIRSMYLSSGVDTLLFKMSDAHYVNGVMLAGDSVAIDYIEGNNDTLRALVVNVIPAAPHIIELGKGESDTLATAPLQQAPEIPDSESVMRYNIHK